MNSRDEQTETDIERLQFAHIRLGDALEFASEQMSAFNAALWEGMPAECLAAEMDVDVMELPFSLN